MPEPPSLHEATIDVAEVTARPSLCVPAPGAEKLLMTDFTERWIHLRDPGVAVMPTQVCTRTPNAKADAGTRTR